MTQTLNRSDLLDEDCLTPEEVCQRLHIHGETLRRMIRAGVGPPFVQLNRETRRFPPALLREWMAARTQPSENRAS